MMSVFFFATCQCISNFTFPAAQPRCPLGQPRQSNQGKLCKVKGSGSVVSYDEVKKKVFVVIVLFVVILQWKMATHFSTVVIGHLDML